MAPNATVDRLLQSVAPDVCVDREVLGTLIEQRPGADAIVALLSVPSVDIVRAAIVYIGLYGSMRDCPLLVLCLQHRDDGVARVAEHCLWAIWMQAGTPEGNRRLAEGIDALNVGEHSRALDVLGALAHDEPAFAEAHFQRGITLGLLERGLEAIASYRETLRVNPYHFAAAAALGHALLELGRIDDAQQQYHQALQIHPRLDDAREALQAVRELTQPYREAN